MFIQRPDSVEAIKARRKGAPHFLDANAHTVLEHGAVFDVMPPRRVPVLSNSAVLSNRSTPRFPTSLCVHVVLDTRGPDRPRRSTNG